MYPELNISTFTYVKKENFIPVGISLVVAVFARPAGTH